MQKKVVLIVGFSHSGSSIAGRLLNCQPHSVNIGEVHQYRKYQKRGVPCGCGKLLEDCEFWSQFVHHSDYLLLGFKYFRKGQLRKRLNHTLGLYEDMFSKHNELELIVDSSKKALRALLICVFGTSKFQFEIVHTKRPWRDVWISKGKRKDLPEAGRSAKNRLILLVAFPYLSLQLLMLRVVCLLLNIKFQTLALQQVKNFIDVHKNQLSTLKLDGDGNYVLNDVMNHAIGGSSSSRDSQIVKVTAH